MVSVDIDERGLGTIGIADANGEINAYRIRQSPRGLSLWAVELTRVDSDSTYLVRVMRAGVWECDCPAEKYRKRGSDHCKHVQAMTSFRAWITSFLEPTRERHHEQRSSG